MMGLDVAGPLEAGVRVSLELPEAGTCVGVVSSKGLSTGGQASLTLDLLDELPEDEVEPGSTIDLFMPRPEGIYHWLCALSSATLRSAGAVGAFGLAVGCPAPVAPASRCRTERTGTADPLGPARPRP